MHYNTSASYAQGALQVEAKRLRVALLACEQARQAAELAAAERRAGESELREKATVAKLDKGKKLGRQAVQDVSSACLQVQAQQTTLDTAAPKLDGLRQQAAKAKAAAKKAEKEAAELRGRLRAPEPVQAGQPSHGPAGLDDLAITWGQTLELARHADAPACPATHP